MFKAKVNDDDFLIEFEGKTATINGDLFDADIAKLEDGKYSLIYNNRVFNLSEYLDEPFFETKKLVHIFK